MRYILGFTNFKSTCFNCGEPFVIPYLVGEVMQHDEINNILYINLLGVGHCPHCLASFSMVRVKMDLYNVTDEYKNLLIKKDNNEEVSDM